MISDSQRRRVALVCVVLVYGVILVATGLLGFDARKDEITFWATTQRFVPPGSVTLEALRSYDQGMTPLAFLLWAAIERVTGLGIAGRDARCAWHFPSRSPARSR